MTRRNATSPRTPTTGMARWLRLHPAARPMPEPLELSNRSKGEPTMLRRPQPLTRRNGVAETTTTVAMAALLLLSILKRPALQSLQMVILEMPVSEQ